MVLTVLMSCRGGPSTPYAPVYNLPVPSTVSNTVPVTVGANGIPNGVFTSVTVCTPAVYPVGQDPNIGGPPPAPVCQTINNILVDTASVGLRLVDNGEFSQVPYVADRSNHPVLECVQFADFSYVWGPVVLGTVQMAGETAAQVPMESVAPNTGIPIQVIATPYDQANGFEGGLVSVPAAPTSCLSSPLTGGLPNDVNSLQNLGINGILGVGTFLQDCGADCASSTPPNQYFVCPAGDCSAVSVPQNLQVWNPVAAFAYDNDGLMLSLPEVFPLNGSQALTGSLTFGIDTQSDNTLGGGMFALDAYGNFPQVTFTYQQPTLSYPTVLVSYMSPQNGSYIDTGSPAIYFSDAQTLGIPECLSASSEPLSFYCPPEALSGFSATVFGTNQSKYTFTWNLLNAQALLKNGNSVFNTLGGDSGVDASTDFVDLGLPFFLGRSTFVGFAGTTIEYPQGQVNTYSNGYWAF